MKVAMVAFSHTEYAIELTESLAKRVSAKLLLPRSDFRRYETVVDGALEAVTFEKPRMRDPRHAAMLVRIARAIGEIDPDVVHIQHLPGEHVWFDLLVLPLLARKRRLVVTIHDVTLHSGDRASSRVPFIHGIFKAHAPQYIVHGERLKAELVSEHGVRAADVHVVKRGMNAIYARYRGEATAEERCTALFFGRIWEYKGLRYLIEAEPLVSRVLPDFRVIIAGSGEDFEKYRKLMVNPERFVVHNENVPNDRVGTFFRRAGVVVLPYVDASQSAIIPQAYVFRKPVVVTDVGSLPEVVEEGVTGYVVPPRDPARLAEAIIKALQDDRRRREMGEQAYRKAMTELSWDRIAEETVAVYQRAVGAEAWTAPQGGQRMRDVPE